MVEWLRDLHPVWQALVATSLTWGVTALGAGFVFLTRRSNRKLLDAMLGFSAGVMIAASFWSLLGPAIESARGGSIPAWAVAATGFLLVGACLWSVDRVLPHLHLGFETHEAEGRARPGSAASCSSSRSRCTTSPKGWRSAVRRAASARLHSRRRRHWRSGSESRTSPEGFAVAMPLRLEGVSRLKSFWYGQLSAIVEPVAGAAGVTLFRPALPYALAFAAGGMVYVVVEELIPESHRTGNLDLAMLSLMGGFTLMMVLDVGAA